MDEWLWMCSLPGFYRRDFGRLLQYFKEPWEIRAAGESQIRMLPFLNDKQKETLLQQKKTDPKEIRYKLETKRIKLSAAKRSNILQNYFRCQITHVAFFI